MTAIWHWIAGAAAAATVAQAAAAQPAVRLEVISREAAFGGRVFEGRGAYETIRGVAHMRIDPKAPENRRIVDLSLAPRDADGMVAYDIDVALLRPVDSNRARRVMLYDVVNRGMKLTAMLSGGSSMQAEPFDPGNGRLLREGYTMVWSGWQGDLPARLMTGQPPIAARLPVARQSRGPVTGRVANETIFDNTTGNRIKLTYPAASLDQSDAKLTVAARTGSQPQVIPASDWKYEGPREISLTRPASMDAGAIYRFEYTARDPWVMGLGFAATRDFISWLRHAPAAAGNPLATIGGAPCERDDAGRCIAGGTGHFTTAIAVGTSQSGRYLRDFVWQGFNRDASGRKVFEGVVALIPGGRQTFTNFRFGEPGRFSRQHEDHDVPGFTFPFTYATITDPVTGRKDGVMKACSADGTCPRLFHIDTSGEFWQAGASLVGTGGTGRDVAFPANVRAYMIAGGSHAPGFASPRCRHAANPFNYAPVGRALTLAMVDWTLGRVEPPPSRWPSLDRGELVPLATMRGPASASTGIEWPAVMNQPTVPAGKQGWPMFVPAVDADGIDKAGIHLPEIAVPTGTYLGWNLRKAGYAEGDLCFPEGSFVPFATDAAARGNDPRPSLAERYPNPADRAALVARTVEQLRKDRLLLDEDAERYLSQAPSSP